MSIEDKLNLIDSIKAELNQLTIPKDWDDEFFRKVKIDFTYSSNKLEGNTLTYGQTIKLLKEFVSPRDAKDGEVLDMTNHHAILNTVFSNYRSQEISEENIKALHYELMKSPAQWFEEGYYSPGRYKQFENMAMRSTGKIHKYLKPGEVPEAMNSLMEKTNNLINQAELHPLKIVTLFHQSFLNIIHPFADGNGRIGRIFINLILLKKGFPPIFIKEVNKEDYLKVFEISDTDDNPMLEFLADRLIESLHEKREFLASR